MGKIAVIMCCWKRIENLTKTLELLQKQTFSDFDFYIWNNNYDKRSEIESIILNNPLNISIHHSKINVGGIARFYQAQQIWQNYKWIVTIDDDQIFSNDFIEHMLNNAQERSIVSRFGWKINKHFYDRTRVLDSGDCDYCGTNGMIVDPILFSDIEYNVPKKYIFVEDLWLSYWAKYERGFKLIGIDAKIEAIEDGKDQCQFLVSEKKELVILLRRKYGLLTY